MDRKVEGTAWVLEVCENHGAGVDEVWEFIELCETEEIAIQEANDRIGRNADDMPSGARATLCNIMGERG